MLCDLWNGLVVTTCHASLDFVFWVKKCWRSTEREKERKREKEKDKEKPQASPPPKKALQKKATGFNDAINPLTAQNCDFF